MDEYSVKFAPRVERDLDAIFEYIAETLLAPEAAEKLVDSIEEAMFSLETMPHRGAPRRTGVYSKGDYRQLFVENYTIIYRANPAKRLVTVVTVRYSPSSF